LGLGDCSRSEFADRSTARVPIVLGTARWTGLEEEFRVSKEATLASALALPFSLLVCVVTRIAATVTITAPNSTRGGAKPLCLLGGLRLALLLFIWLFLLNLASSCGTGSSPDPGRDSPNQYLWVGS